MKCQKISESIIKSREEEINRKMKGFSNKIKSFFLNDDYSTDEFTLEERRKVTVYLNFSLQHLSDMFQIKEVK